MNFKGCINWPIVFSFLFFIHGQCLHTGAYYNNIIENLDNKINLDTKTNISLIKLMLTTTTLLKI